MDYLHVTRAQWEVRRDKFGIIISVSATPIQGPGSFINNRLYNEAQLGLKPRSTIHSVVLIDCPL